MSRLIDVRFSGLRTGDGGKAAGMSYLCFGFNSLEEGYQRVGGLTTKNATSDKYTTTRECLAFDRWVCSCVMSRLVANQLGDLDERADVRALDGMGRCHEPDDIDW